MNMHLTDEELISSLEGPISKNIESHLKTCETCTSKRGQFSFLLAQMENSTEIDPPQSLSWEIESAIADELKQSQSIIIWVKIAASIALLITAFFVGKWSSRDEGKQLTSLTQEVAALKEVSLAQFRSSSASERIYAVNQVQEPVADQEFVFALVRILNFDESPNVRYAVVQALGRMIDEKYVREELVKSLDHQTDPLIQIALINLLLDAKEKSAIAPMKNIIKSNEINPEVKRQAEIALQLLI